MRRILFFVAGLGLAAGVHAAVGTYLPQAAGLFDLFLILAVYYSLTTNQVAGMGVGLVCGLVQDGLFASPPLGRNAFAKVLVGYLVGGLGRRFELSQPFPQLMVLVGATLLQTLTLASLHLVLGMPADLPSGQRILLGMAGNGLVGLMLFRTGRRAGGTHS